MKVYRSQSGGKDSSTGQWEPADGLCGQAGQPSTRQLHGAQDHRPQHPRQPRQAGQGEPEPRNAVRDGELVQEES